MQLFTDLAAAGLGPLEIVGSILLVAVVSVVGSEMVSPGNGVSPGYVAESMTGWLSSF